MKNTNDTIHPSLKKGYQLANAKNRLMYKLLKLSYELSEVEPGSARFGKIVQAITATVEQRKKVSRLESEVMAQYEASR